MVCMVLHWLLPLWLPTGTWIPPSDCSPWLQTRTNYWSTNSTTLISPRQMVRQGGSAATWPQATHFWSSKILMTVNQRCIFTFTYTYYFILKSWCVTTIWSFRTCLQKHHPRVWTDLQHSWRVWPERPLTWSLCWSCGKVSKAMPLNVDQFLSVAVHKVCVRGWHGRIVTTADV